MARKEKKKEETLTAHLLPVLPLLAQRAQQRLNAAVRRDDLVHACRAERVRACDLLEVRQEGHRGEGCSEQGSQGGGCTSKLQTQRYSR